MYVCLKIERVEEFKYLGLTVDPSLWKGHEMQIKGEMYIIYENCDHIRLTSWL